MHVPGKGAQAALGTHRPQLVQVLVAGLGLVPVPVQGQTQR